MSEDTTFIPALFENGFKRLGDSIDIWESMGDNDMVTCVLEDIRSVEIILEEYIQTNDKWALFKRMDHLDTYVRETFYEVLEALAK